MSRTPLLLYLSPALIALRLEDANFSAWLESVRAIQKAMQS